ncbi:MAG: cytochrome P450 [Pseudomonadales bacterium]|nr:cytochrome P450 [Pseudomonadales bacterium]
MNAPVPDLIKIAANRPLNLQDRHLVQNRWAYYQYLREHLPVHRAKLLGVKFFVTARYDDCLTVVKDERFGRNRAKITGGSRFPFPVPSNLKFLAESIINEDDPQHRRLRQLVQKAFSPKSLTQVELRVNEWAQELAQACVAKGEFSMQEDYALPIPMRAIAEMVGVSENDMPRFREGVRALSEGLNGWRIARTIFWDLRNLVKFVRELVERKKQNPSDDILSGLIAAEIEGDRLGDDELVSMVFILIIAGFETTANLISNGVITLLEHPDELAKLRSNPSLYGSAVEELLRFSGPVHGTKMNYAREDIEIRGVVIPKGMAVMPILGSANRDEAVFDNPNVFDIQRDPNKHLSFSQGNHFCLGAFLARMEAKIAFKTLFESMPQLELASIPEPATMPGWHRYRDYRLRVR